MTWPHFHMIPRVYTNTIIVEISLSYRNVSLLGVLCLAGMMGWPIRRNLLVNVVRTSRTKDVRNIIVTDIELANVPTLS